MTTSSAAAPPVTAPPSFPFTAFRSVFSNPSPSSPTARPSNPLTRTALYRWLHSRRFPFAALVCLSSVTLTTYRIHGYTDSTTAQAATRDDLTQALQQLQAHVQRRKQTLQQRLHAVWALPPSYSPPARLSPPTPPPPPSSSSWLSLSSWARWWQGSTTTPPASSPVHYPATFTLPRSGCTVNPALFSLTSHQPDPALLQAVVLDCDDILHTGVMPIPSPKLAPILAAAGAAQTERTVEKLQEAWGAGPSPAGGAVTGVVTGSGKRLMV